MFFVSFITFNKYLTVYFNILWKSRKDKFFNFGRKAKMLFKRTNIEVELQQLRNSSLNSEALIQEFYKVLEEATENEKRINDNTQRNFKQHQNNFTFDYLETNKIYHVSQIKTICITYRLRFLDASYFKGKIPAEAISKIKKLEERHGTELKNFKIVAPSKLFKLEDKDDPLLFAPLGNDYYYLIHKWGTDLSPFRKLKMWPFKSIVNILLLIFVTTFFATYLSTSILFSSEASTSKIFIIGFFIFKTLVAIVLYFGVAKGKNFSPFIWNSKYYN